jgi:hypothetical protein
MVINMGRTFSLATLLLLTAFIAGWLGLLRIAPELATIFAVISIPALWRAARAAGRYAHSEMGLPLVDRVALFLISQTVVIACLVIPLVCGTIATWLGWALAFFLADGSGRQTTTIFVFGLILGLVAALAAFIVAIRKLGPVRSTGELPSRWLALASGAPAGFFAFCSVALYGDGRMTTALFLVPGSLLPRLVACLIVVPALLRTVAQMTRRRRSGHPLIVKDLMMTLVRDVALMAGTVLAAVLSGCAVWICFYCLSVHSHRSSPIIQVWSELCELLAPAAAVSIATMVAIYLVQTGFMAGIVRIAYAFDADHSPEKKKEEGCSMKAE